MRIFAYEFLTGGGRYSLQSDEELSFHLMVEGRAMIQAICHDLARIPRVQVHALWDHYFPDQQRPPAQCAVVKSAEDVLKAFDCQVLNCAYTLIIAPEFGHSLLTLAQRALELGAVLLSPGPELIALASDKCATANWLRDAGIPVPETARCRTLDQVPRTITWPAVLKPIHGAGSQGVRYVDSRQAASILSGCQEFCLQQYATGKPASVAAICGPVQQMLLPPCWQHLDSRSFAYLSGSRINEPAYVKRASDLAERVLASLPDPRGYLGIDLILGPREDGSTDFVIEVNPRLTTSYIGLRAMTPQNLAAAMLNVCAGIPVTLSFPIGPLEFRPDGQIHNPTSVGEFSTEGVKDSA